MLTENMLKPLCIYIYKYTIMSEMYIKYNTTVYKNTILMYIKIHLPM